MAYKPGGVDPGHIQEGFAALEEVRSVRDLERLIEDLPVLSAPIFHVRLTQELRRQVSAYGAPLPGFVQLYDYFFMCLHARAYRHLVEAARPAAAQARHGAVVPFAPPYFSEIAAALGDRLPGAEGPTLNPATDANAILSEIQAVVGRGVTLPEYQPPRGSHWSVILVACASCRHARLKPCAYGVDLAQAPALAEPLRDGSLNNSPCPLCSEALCVPLRVWLQDGPGAGDDLASLTCAWRLSDTAFIYQPPPGTAKIERNNYILEVRFDRLLQRLGWSYRRDPEGESPEGVRLSFAIAYDVGEVADYISRMTCAQPAVPFAMEVMIREFTRKLESGLLPIYDVEGHVRKTIGINTEDWPIVVTEDPLAHSRHPYNFVVISLIGEALAEARKHPAAVRAFLASRTYMGYFSIGEVALAEAALTRAADFLTKVPAGDPGYAAAAMGVAEARSQLLSFLGRHAEAEQAREQIGNSPLLAGDTLPLRLARQQLKSQEALSLKRQGRLAEAVKLYYECVATLESMEAEGAASEGDASRILGQIRHMLSGDFANWGAILVTLAERLEAVGKMHELVTGGAAPDEVARVMKASHLEPDDLPVTVDAVAVLEEMFSPGITSKTLFKLGRLLFEKALDLSEAGEQWEFAGIQAHRLAGLLHSHFEEHEAAQELMRKAVGYASRVGDHRRVSSGHFFFAELAIKRGDGPEALDHLLISAREEISEQVGSGYYADPKGMRLPLSDAALRTVALGGDPRVAVMIVESLKVPTTAASMVSGIPDGPGGEAGQRDSTRLDELLASRERLHLKAGREAQADDDAGEELRRIELEITEQRKALSLRDSRFTRWVDATHLDVSEPRALLRRLGRLGPRTTLLGILPVGRTVWTYALWDGGCILSEQPLPPLEGQPPPDYVSPSEPRETWTQDYLEQLAAALLNPLEARLAELGPDDRLVISASDPLALVPFSALPYRGRPLCEHVCISQTHGVGVMEACLDRAGNGFGSVLCVGNPSRPDREELPDTHLEVVTVAGLFRESGKQALSLTWDLATVPYLKAEAERYDVLHFACHAEVGSAQGESSRLLLTPDLKVQDSGNLSEDRILSEIPLRVGCLVNLAGCQTGVQSDSKGFLLGGLVPSFLIAGAGSVIGSLWELDDAGTATFQIEFYRSLLQGRSAAVSLAETQRACLRGELGPAMRDASMWAGYVLYGAG